LWLVGKRFSISLLTTPDIHWERRADGLQGSPNSLSARLDHSILADHRSEFEAVRLQRPQHCT
jgi:hypothetical protein